MKSISLRLFFAALMVSTINACGGEDRADATDTTGAQTDVTDVGDGSATDGVTTTPTMKGIRHTAYQFQVRPAQEAEVSEDFAKAFVEGREFAIDCEGDIFVFSKPQMVEVKGERPEISNEKLCLGARRSQQEGVMAWMKKNPGKTAGGVAGSVAIGYWLLAIGYGVYRAYKYFGN